MGIGFHLDDVEEIYFSEKLGYELPQEPKFYPSISFTTSITNSLKSKCPTSEKEYYEVKEDGVYKINELFDQDGKSMYAHPKMIMSKEVFVEAYNAYIKDSEVLER